MSAAANVMRRILVDYARARGRLKRGGESDPIMLAEWHAALPGTTIDILAVDEALTGAWLSLRLREGIAP